MKRTPFNGLRVRMASLMARSVIVFVLTAATLRAGTVLTVDGVLHDGELSLDNGLVVRGSTATVRLPISSVLRARFGTASSDDMQPGLVLAGGARIAGAFSSLSEPVVKVALKQIAIPGKEVAWAVYLPLSSQLVAQIPRGKIGALLPGGDFFEGPLKGGDSNSARVLNPIFGPRIFDARKKEIHALILREITPQPAVFDVVTRDGSIYPALDVVARDASGVTLRHPLFDGLRIAVADLVEIRASASRLTPLDSFKPARIDPAPNRDAANCFASNQSLDGGPLRLGNRVVAAGFESAAGATVWWSLPPGAGTFVALVAASASTPGGQKISFTVYAENKLVARSPLLGAGDPPVVLRCALPNAAKLTLRIEGAEGAGTWAEPVLLRR